VTPDVAASVRQRLLNLAKSKGDPFQRVLDRFVMERFLYRLSVSRYAGIFALKGAALYYLWSEVAPRPTRDLDLLAWGEPDIPSMEETFREICGIDCPEDALTFDPGSVQGSRIREGNPYKGIRVQVRGRLGTARVSLQVDIGFGDSVVPPLVEADYPTLLGHPVPKVRAYPWETAIAEKLHTMVYLGLDNSRAKDYFDLWHLAKDHTFDGEPMVLAVRATFARRAMPWPDGIPEGLSDRFGLDPDKQAQWQGFLRKSGISGAPPLVEVVQDIRGFLKPVLDAGADGAIGLGRWASGSWSQA
jgi:predicted nucleotidyltransferase component of viral defense system